MLAALKSKVQPVLFGSAVNACKNCLRRFFRAAGAYFAADNFTGAAANNKNLTCTAADIEALLKNSTQLKSFVLK